MLVPFVCMCSVSRSMYYQCMCCGKKTGPPCIYSTTAPTASEWPNIGSTPIDLHDPEPRFFAALRLFWVYWLFPFTYSTRISTSTYSLRSSGLPLWARFPVGCILFPPAECCLCRALCPCIALFFSFATLTSLAFGGSIVLKEQKQITLPPKTGRAGGSKRREEEGEGWVHGEGGLVLLCI